MTESRDLSITLTSFFMRCTGFWLAADEDERRRRFATLGYTVAAISFAIYVEATDFYYTWGDLADSTYTACNILSLAMVLVKIFVLLYHRTELLALIQDTLSNFWHQEYDLHEEDIFRQCKRICTVFICCFTFFANSTVISYGVTPILENFGKNESDRVLPFNMWLDLPLSLSPYFEIAFITQILSLCHVGICFFCFDNLLGIMNVHAAGQFRILQYRFSKMCAHYPKGDTSSRTDPYQRMRSLITQHQGMIDYCQRLENVFSLLILGQVLVSSVQMCLVGYQILLANAAPARRIIFSFHIMSCLSQLTMITYSCDSLIRESSRIGTAAYGSAWPVLPPETTGQKFRNDLTMIIFRSQKPCCLTACRFFPVSLETYTAVLSTAMSYFTLLRQRSQAYE